MPAWQPQRREMFSLKYRPASSGSQLKRVQTNRPTLSITEGCTIKVSPVRCVPPSPGRPRSSLLMTSVSSDFCLLARLTSSPLLFPASRVVFIETEPARERLVCEFPGFHPSVQWARGTRCRGGGGLVRQGAPIGYLSGCCETVSHRRVYSTSVSVRESASQVCLRSDQIT